MSLTIKSNQSSSIALRSMQAADAAMTRSLAKLASGSRVQSARDDAAAMAIGSRIKAQIGSLKSYVNNATQGIALLQTAEGAYQRVEDMLNRMRSLASQAQGRNISTTERGMLNTEYQQIKNEITRIAKGTTFAGQALFDVSSTLQVSTASQIPGAGSGFGNGYAMLDVNGDDILDMVQTDINDGKTYTMLGNGDGTFTNSTPYQINSVISPTTILAGDFNGDGIQDIAATDGGTLEIWINSGTGFSLSYSSAISALAVGTQMAIGDINNDDKDDIAYVDTSNVIRTYSMNLSGGFTATIQGTTVGSTTSLMIGDVNNDGSKDIVTVGTNIQTWINNGYGSFTGGTTTATGNYAYQASLIDMNNDGTLDVVARNLTGTGIRIFQYSSSWATAATIAVGNTTNIAVGDFNADGINDLIMNEGAVTVTARLGTGNFGFSNSQTLIASGISTNYYATQLADLNNDGRLDIITDDMVTIGMLAYLNTTQIGQEGSYRVSDSASSNNNIAYRLGSIRLNSLDNQLEFSVINTIGGSKRAETSIKNALENLMRFRTSAAAVTNRLQKVQENVATIIENQENAQSAYLDLDIADEMSRFLSKQLLVQAGISMIAQANQQPRNLLRLFELKTDQA